MLLSVSLDLEKSNALVDAASARVRGVVYFILNLMCRPEDGKMPVTSRYLSRVRESVRGHRGLSYNIYI